MCIIIYSMYKHRSDHVTSKLFFSMNPKTVYNIISKNCKIYKNFLLVSKITERNCYSSVEYVISTQNLYYENI